MSKELKSEIVDVVMDPVIAFREQNGKPATSVYLTPDIEQKIGKLTADDIGALSGGIFQKGVRAGMTRILGLDIKSWDSDTVKVE
jgi:hypothetical protein